MLLFFCCCFFFFFFFLGGGGGAKRTASSGGPRGRHRNDFSPITFIVHNQKSNGGANGGLHGVNGRPWPPRTPLITPLVDSVVEVHSL